MKHLHRGWAFILCCCMLCMGVSGAYAAENLLSNGDFETVREDWPVDWFEDMWLYDAGTTYLEVSRDGIAGGTCVMIENVMYNDARFMQIVPVQPDTVYRFSAMVKVEGAETAKTGANLSVLDCYETFPSLHDTAGAWQELTCYFRTDPRQETAEIALRLGGYSNDNIGKAWFDQASLERVDVLPEGVIPIALTLRERVEQEEELDTWEEDASKPQGGMLWVLLPAFLLLLCLVWRYARAGTAQWKNRSIRQGAVWAILGLAAVLRVVIAITVEGYRVDITCFQAWSQRMAQTGPGGFYAEDYFCDYPPGYLYVLWINGLLMRLWNMTAMTPSMLLLLKFVPMVADLCTAYILYQDARKPLQEGPALGLALLYLCNPAVLTTGAAWGQIDAVLTLGLLLTLRYAVRGDWLRAFPSFFLSVLCKPQALMLAPIGLVALAADLWRRRKEKGAWIGASMGLGIGVVVSLILLIPFTAQKGFGWVIGQYANTLSSYPYASINAANLFYLLGGNWVEMTQRLGMLSYAQWGTIFIVLTVVYCAVTYVLSKRRDTLYLVSAVLLIGLYTLGMKMHERYLFPALLLLLAAYVQHKDRRVMGLFCGLSITLFINVLVVLRYEHMTGAHVPLGMILSAIQVMLCALAFWTVWDVCVRGHIQPLPTPRLQPRCTNDARMQERLLAPAAAPHRMQGWDWALMLSLTAVYAVVAFTGLGDTKAPQSGWQSTGFAEQVTFDLGKSQGFSMMYYGGISPRSFSIATSEDGVHWGENRPAELTMGDCFRWKYQMENVQNAEGAAAYWTDQIAQHTGRYVRLTADGPGLSLFEIAFRDAEGHALPVQSLTSSGARTENGEDPTHLIDEQNTMPDVPGYMNGTYFDEIYHARTGYEHAHGMTPLETTHPPLGKVFIMWGIQIFGMTPFGWRFMGALAGVLMIPAMYMIGKVLFGKKEYAFLAAFLMAFDCMHLTQTRIATIDSFPVLFIILMYLCMFRYLQMSFHHEKLLRTLLPLALSGVFMGLGVASKWIAVYAGIGLAVLFFWSMARRAHEYLYAREQLRTNATEHRAQWQTICDRFVPATWITLLWCVLFFMVVPLAIYMLSYIPHLTADGPYTLKRLWDAQVYMFSYHSHLVDTHAFQSPWYEWPLMLKPMWYFQGKLQEPGKVSTILSFGNPAVWWTGFAALLALLWRFARHGLRLEVQTAREDLPMPMILLGFAAQYVPWMLVPRSTFIYHYFASVPFIILCIVYWARVYAERAPRMARRVALGYMAVVVVLFLAFYPLATGVVIPRTWAAAMNWFGFLKLPNWQYQGWMFF